MSFVNVFYFTNIANSEIKVLYCCCDKIWRELIFVFNKDGWFWCGIVCALWPPKKTHSWTHKKRQTIKDFFLHFINETILISIKLWVLALAPHHQWQFSRLKWLFARMLMHLQALTFPLTLSWTRMPFLDRTKTYLNCVDLEFYCLWHSDLPSGWCFRIVLVLRAWKRA